MNESLYTSEEANDLMRVNEETTSTPLEHTNEYTEEIQMRVRERPWAAFGLALVGGYLLGRMGSSSSGHHNVKAQQPVMVEHHTERGAGVGSVVASAATSVLTAVVYEYARKNIAPKIEQRLEQVTQRGNGSTGSSGGRVPTSAPNAAMGQEVNTADTNYDEIPSTMTRFGAGADTLASGSEYYDVAADRTERDDPESIDKTENYTQ